MKALWLGVGIAWLSACAAHEAAVGARGFQDAEQYRAARAALVERERAMRTGAALVLSAVEISADRRLSAIRQRELARTRDTFPPARNFLLTSTKQAIAASPVLAVMRRMPKGGILHAHGSAMGDFRWLVSHATYLPNCYIYVGDGPGVVRGALRLAAAPPGEGWRLVSELRAAAPDRAAFDEAIFQSLTLGEEDLAEPHIWDEFARNFQRSSGLLADRAVHAGYWRRMLRALIDENVQYLESRTPPIDEAILRDARDLDPVFDVKFIPAAARSAGRESVARGLAAAVDQRVNDPDRVKGFDLVQEEDATHTNLFYLEELLAARRAAERRGTSLPLYLHSGESNWAENDNLYDAVLLGAPRIGHGLALIKHPLLMEMVKARDVAIEVCPLSNQMLGFVPDLRTHPAATYINAGLAVVLSPDDPGMMQHSLSHDFYAAFMAWGLDLRTLKQLARNSLVYSAMNADERTRALAAWEQRWQDFVTWLADGDGSGPD